MFVEIDPVVRSNAELEYPLTPLSCIAAGAIALPQYPFGMQFCDMKFPGR